jgi:hypothetical protein
MANWQRKLQLKDIWHNDDVHMIAAETAKRLKALQAFPDADLDEQRLDIADEFEGLSTDPKADKEDFDCVLERLYDWADTKLDNNWNGKKVCWVETF